jgi:hypothetical protein
MSFKMPDLIVESIIRDGFKNARRDESVIDDVFADLTLAYASKKYGEAEIEKIKAMVREKEVSIIHSFNLSAVNMPCISIQLADDREDEKSFMGNYLTTFQSPMTNPEEIAALTKLTFTPVSYDPNTGIVRVDDSVNLSAIHANLIFEDADGAEYVIVGGIVNDTGAKQFIIAKQSEVALTGPGQIKSSINYKLYTRNGNKEQTQLILGIHSKDALVTKYLYTLVKYFVLTRRPDLIKRGLQITTYQGSDFSRSLEYTADIVYTRFFHIVGTVVHSWRQDKVQLIDNVEVNVQVPKDRLGNEALKLTDMTIKVKE